MKKLIVLSTVLFLTLSPTLSESADPIFPDLSGLEGLSGLGSCMMGFGGGSRSVKSPTDLDRDGFGVADGDCDDSDAAVHPGAAEIPGNIWDENCDNVLDCNPDVSWKSHDEFVECVSQSVEQLVSAGAITEMRGNWLIESASGLEAIGMVPVEATEDLRPRLAQVEEVASLSPGQKEDEERLAYVIESQSVTKVSMRTEPKTLLDNHIRAMLPRYDFYDAYWNPQGSFHNDLVDNGDGTITDRSTGLMWQKSGSSGMKSREGARRYVNGLNGFAGHC